MADFLLDTNIVVDFLRGHEGTIALWAKLIDQGELCLSAISYLEIVAGIRPNEQNASYDVLAELTALPLDTYVADQAGQLVARYRARGITLDIADAAVAATAILHDLTVVTYNKRHFPMPELALYPI
jgi:predicted nucleic acid-binding protein